MLFVEVRMKLGGSRAFFMAIGHGMVSWVDQDVLARVSIS